MASPFPILAFDCSGLQGSVALRVGEKTTCIHLEQGKQAGLLMASIDALLQSHHLDYAAIGRIVTTIGPGSFTGLRIALASLHGWMMVHPTPLSLLTTTEAVAWDIAARGKESHFRVALHAGKGEVFCQDFHLESQRPVACSSISLHPRTFVGPQDYSDQHPCDHPYFVRGVEAQKLTPIAQHLPLHSLQEAKPYYIRPADAKPPAPFAWL